MIIYRPIPYLPECVHVHVLLEYCLMYTLSCTCLKVWLHTLYMYNVHMLPSYHATSRPDFDFTETISMIPEQLFDDGHRNSEFQTHSCLVLMVQ